MYKNWASDPEVVKYLTWPVHSSQKVSQMIIDDWISKYDEKMYHWTIVIKENGDEPIGDISVVRITEDIGLVEIGYCISQKWWNQKVTSEALMAVIDFLFDKVDVNRIQARHDPRNPNSGRVMKHCGMKYEGTLRSSDRNNQGICDACIYSILKSER